jgi:dienelactone hydrolase
MVALMVAFAWIQESGAAPRAGLPIASIGGIKLEREGKRPLEVRATFPQSGGTYPVIVFSHGMYGNGDAVRPLTDEFARRGYVVLAPTHGDSLRYADAATVRNAWQGRLDNVSSWSERPGELSLVIDRLSEIEERTPGLQGRVDPARIGIGGHSFGAWTTQALAGMTLRGGVTWADPRPSAFLAISPSGVGGGITQESLSKMRGPMMMVSGDNDFGRFGGDPKVFRRQAFDAAPPGDKYLVWIDGAYHNFGGINERPPDSDHQRSALRGRLLGPSNPVHVQAVVRASLAFWDAYLKGDPQAKSWLSESGLGAIAGVTVWVK